MELTLSTARADLSALMRLMRLRVNGPFPTKQCTAWSYKRLENSQFNMLYKMRCAFIKLTDLFDEWRHQTHNMDTL